MKDLHELDEFRLTSDEQRIYGVNGDSGNGCFNWPTSTYDSCDAPYDEEFLTTAAYDSAQKIWHLDWGEQLNTLIDIEDAPLNSDHVTHWMPLPTPREVDP